MTPCLKPVMKSLVWSVSTPNRPPKEPSFSCTAAEARQEATLLGVKVDGNGVVGDGVGVGALRPGSGVDGDEHDVRILVFCFICSLHEGESRHDEHVVAGVDKIGDGLENSRGGVFRGLQIADLNAVIGGSLLQTFPCGLDKRLVVNGGRAANQTDFQRGGIHGGIRGGVFAGVFGDVYKRQVSAVSADVPDWAVSLEAASFVLPELHAAKHSSSKHTVRMRQSIFFISSVSPFVSFCGCTAATDYSIIQNRHDQV